MPRQGRESSLNKNKVLIAGLTLLLVSGFILVGACCGLVLTQLEELNMKMSDMEGKIRQNTDTINDLGGTTNSPYEGSYLLNARIDTLSTNQNENYQMLQRFERYMNQSLAEITKQQKENDNVFQNLSYPTKQPGGDTTVQGHQGVKHQMYQQLAMSLDRLDTKISNQADLQAADNRYKAMSIEILETKISNQANDIASIKSDLQAADDRYKAMPLNSETDIANLRTDSQAADALINVNIASLNESINYELSLLHNVLDGMDNASDGMLFQKAKSHPTTPSIEMIALLHTKVENMSTAIVEVQDFLHNATALITPTDRNLFYSQLHNLEIHLNGTSRDQQNMRENINSLYTQLDNLEKSTLTAMNESLQNFSHSFNHTLENIESKMNQHIEMMASMNDTASAERNSLYIQLNNLDKSTTMAIAENLQNVSTILNQSLENIESNMNQHIEMMASMNDSASAERSSLYTELENLDKSTTMAMAENLQNISTIFNHTLEKIESNMNQHIEMMASMNDSASTERNSLYAQLENLDKSTTTAINETSQHISNINMTINEQAAMIDLMKVSNTMVKAYSCGKCTNESSACTLGDYSELTCQRGFFKSHDGFDNRSTYTSFGQIRTDLKNPGFKGLKITLHQFDSNPPTNDACESDEIAITVSEKNFKHCGTAISDLVLYFDVSAIGEGFIQIRFLGLTDNVYSGFMIEFDFQLMPFPESAYKSTENDVVVFYVGP